MNKLLYVFAFLFCFSCSEKMAPKTPTPPTPPTVPTPPTPPTTSMDNFVWNTENFADIKMIRYQIPGFDKLTLKQKELVYYLTEAGLAGRDIMWDMNYRHNLHIRRGIENILKNYKGDKSSSDYKSLLTYAKRMWFSSGIHHHYGNDKFIPGFEKSWFMTTMKETNTTINEKALTAIFNPRVDAKKINFDPSKDLVKASAVNFYDPDITEAEVDAFYGKMMKNKNADQPLSYGLNSKVIRNADGSLGEKVYHLNGMYGAAVNVINWMS